VLRSIAAVALLAACGLAVPCVEPRRVPLYSAVMLRNFSGDSPLEGKSSFALEMKDMGCAWVGGWGARRGTWGGPGWGACCLGLMRGLNHLGWVLAS
jgi:hypothetical protein